MCGGGRVLASNDHVIEDGSSASENTILYVCLKASFSAGFWKVEVIDTAARWQALLNVIVTGSTWEAVVGTGSREPHEDLSYGL